MTGVPGATPGRRGLRLPISCPTVGSGRPPSETARPESPRRRRRPRPGPRRRLPGQGEPVLLSLRGVQPGRPVRGGGRRLRGPGVPGGRGRSSDLRPDGGPGQPAGPLPGRGGHRAGRPRGHLRLQQRPVGRDAVGRVQAAGHLDQHQLPLRGRRAPLPVRQRRPEGPGLSTRLLGPGGRRAARAARAPDPVGRRRREHRVAGPRSVDFESAVAGTSADRDFGPRSADDLYVLYTGGTTGLPKGVVWRHRDVFYALGGGVDPGPTPGSNGPRRWWPREGPR